MNKYAIILASLLAFTGCESFRNGGSNESGSNTDNNAYRSSPSAASSMNNTSGSTATYGQNQVQTPAQSTTDSASQTTANVRSTDQPGQVTGIPNQNPAATTSTYPQATSPTTPGSLSANDQASQSAAATQGQNNLPNSSPSGAATPAPTTPTDQNTLAGNSTAPNTTPGALDSTSGLNSPTTGQNKDNLPATPDLNQGLGTTGQSPTASGTGAQSSLTQNGTDRALTQSVTNSLMIAGISSQVITNIHVRTMNGRVILTGKVSSQDEKQKIEKQVKETPGVQSVSNLLRVQTDNSAFGQPAPNSSSSGGASSLPGSSTPSQSKSPGTPQP